MAIELTEDLYQEALALWLEKPTIAYVSRELGVSRGQVKRLVEEGLPDLDLPPFPQSGKRRGRPPKARAAPRPAKGSIDPSSREAAAKRVLVEEEARQHVAEVKRRLREAEERSKELQERVEDEDVREECAESEAALAEARKRLELEERQIAQVEKKTIAADAVQRSAEEASIARQGMRNVLNMGALMSHITDRILEGVEQGRIEIPDKLDYRVLSSLAASADKLTSAMERAIKIERGRAGEPDSVVGVKIGVLLERCSDEELESMLESGKLPGRLSSAGDSDIIDAE